MKQTEAESTSLGTAPGRSHTTESEAAGTGTNPAAYRAPDGSSPSNPQRPLALPPNTTVEKFNDFIQQVGKIVGVENATVISSDAELQHESYMDPSKAYDASNRS